MCALAIEVHNLHSYYDCNLENGVPRNPWNPPGYATDYYTFSCIVGNKSDTSHIRVSVDALYTTIVWLSTVFYAPKLLCNVSVTNLHNDIP